ncbi:hypothetical protein ACO1O0_000999 [Amphichorda felina]
MAPQGALGTSDKGVQVALIILITLVAAALVATILFLVAKFYRRRRQQYDTVPSVESAKTPNMRMSQRGISDEEELQRIIMIRKSLASRTSTTLDSRRLSQREDDDDDLDHDAATSSSRPGSLRYDWKEFEAGLQSHPSVSLENHPILKSSPEHRVSESYGPRISSPSPLSVRSGLASPPPVAPVMASPPPSLHQPRASWHRTPPQRGVSFEPLRTPPQRAAAYSPPVVPPRRDTCESVPGEYTSVPLADTERPERESHSNS